MITTYTIVRHETYNTSGTHDLLRIIDRDQCIVTTNYGALHVNRRNAASFLREVRRQRNNPFFYQEKQVTTVTYRKEITP